MKIWKIDRVSFALPFDAAPVEYGEQQVDKLLTKYHIQDLDEKYQFKNRLGGGMWGAAFETFDGKVVKITTDGSEYVSSLDLVNAPWQKNSPFATIYEAYQYDDGIFVIVKELVTPLSEEEKTLFDLFIDDFNSDIDQVTPEFSDKMHLFEEFNIYVNDVLNYTQYEDTLNPDNIGRDSNGKLVSFDPRQSSFR